VARSARNLDLRVGGAADALDRFEAAWNRVAEGRAAPQLEVLTFRDLPLLLKTLTPARWALMEALREAPAASIYELAKRLGRDYKNVHTDVTCLSALGLIDKDNGALSIPWDVVRTEFRVGAG